MRRISPRLLAAAAPLLSSTRRAPLPVALCRPLRPALRQLRCLSSRPPRSRRPRSLSSSVSQSHSQLLRSNFLTASLLFRGRPPARTAPTAPSSTAPNPELPASDGYSAGDGQVTRIATLNSSMFDPATLPRLPFRFDTGVALFAKRAPRPFPPPFLSPPSGSFSDPLSTHHHGYGADRRGTYVNGQLIQGATNGDDAVFASEYFICANDGVGAWSARPRGHAGLWARLILHFWAAATFEDLAKHGSTHYTPDPIACLQRAYEQTIAATSAPNDWQGTTTATGALLHFEPGQGSEGPAPVLYVTNIGDSQVMVVRPSDRKLVFKSVEQWHWFDCPRQLGTNSPDTPSENGVLDVVRVQDGDIVLAMSDGVIDNLWTHEIVENVSQSLERWRSGKVKGRRSVDDTSGSGMAFVAEELMEAAKTIALDPFAESPFMERAIDEGLASEGGKLDDISVVAGLVTRSE
ncbi:hypothetical protein GQ53DRAFT_752550 [Thozetella sp. PMI_491]|nr:hypothetical protein GQ53DRAFT_752550 [Thozetella sp. PMI_491]